MTDWDAEIRKIIDSARDPEFMQRIRDHIAKHAPMLKRMAEPPPRCTSTALAILAAVDPKGAELHCTLLAGHAPPHVFHMEWADPEVQT